MASKKKDPKPPKPPKALAPVDAAQRYTLHEAAEYLRQSRAKVYLDIKAGALKTFHDGARRYVPGTELIRRSAA